VTASRKACCWSDDKGPKSLANLANQA
jgi:hypothetical protein